MCTACSGNLLSSAVAWAIAFSHASPPCGDACCLSSHCPFSSRIRCGSRNSHSVSARPADRINRHGSVKQLLPRILHMLVEKSRRCSMWARCNAARRLTAHAVCGHVVIKCTTIALFLHRTVRTDNLAMVVHFIINQSPRVRILHPTVRRIAQGA